MKEDPIEGTAGTADALAPDAIGAPVANDLSDPKGLVSQAVDTVQEGYDKVRGKVRDLIDDAPGAARDAIETGRDYYQRGAAAVTRTMGDNTALVLLAAGAAGAALGWLAFNRRKQKKDAQ
jgi:uncharacterized protein YjbJ (UPF0337 family)